MSSIFIFRRDFRIEDNIGYINCVNKSKKVYPIFIFTPNQITNKNEYKSNNSIQFMIECISELYSKIKINFFFGNEIDVLSSIIKNNKIDAIFTNTDYTPYAKKRDTDLEKFGKSNKININLFDDILLMKPTSILSSSDKIYVKFTPYYNKVMEEFSEPKLLSIKKHNTYMLNSNKYSYKYIDIHDFYKKNTNIYLKGGRTEGLKKLKNIKRNENKLFTNSSSELSPYIKYGCVSIREVFIYNNKLKNKESDRMIRQIIWREFYYNIGYCYDIYNKPMREKYNDIKWIGTDATFIKWKDAKTGFPIVDAIMRQLNSTGYISNRSRLIVASFLIKTLGHNWLKGEKYFAQKLIDYDPLVNNGNWQWVSGTGADIQPYFRIFNPWLQSETYDKKCEYIKLWIPELNDIEPSKIHKWYKYYDTKIYIEPIVSYKKNKDKIIDMYKSVV